MTWAGSLQRWMDDPVSHPLLEILISSISTSASTTTFCSYCYHATHPSANSMTYPFAQQPVAVDWKKHRLNVASHLPATTTTTQETVLFLAGDIHHERHGTDVELSFRQESNF